MKRKKKDCWEDKGRAIEPMGWKWVGSVARALTNSQDAGAH